jgi:hypothetical protein
MPDANFSGIDPQWAPDARAIQHIKVQIAERSVKSAFHPLHPRPNCVFPNEKRAPEGARRERLRSVAQ